MGCLVELVVMRVGKRRLVGQTTSEKPIAGNHAVIINIVLINLTLHFSVASLNIYWTMLSIQNMLLN